MKQTHFNILNVLNTYQVQSHYTLSSTNNVEMTEEGTHEAAYNSGGECFVSDRIVSADKVS